MALVELAGEIDMATAPRAKACIDGCIADGALHLAIDLTEVTFLATTGISLLIEIDKRIKERRGHLYLIGASDNRQVSRPLNLLGLAQQFSLASDLAAVHTGSEPPDTQQS